MPVGSIPGPLVLADFDTDGDLDLVTLSTDPNAGGLTIRLNGGTVLAARPEASQAASLQVYPNPVSRPSRQVQLRVSGLGTRTATVVVLNTLGQQLARQELTTGSTLLSLPQLAAGTYLVRLTTADGQQTSQLLLVD